MSITLKIDNGDVVIGAITGQPTTISDKAVRNQHIVENLTIERLPNGFGVGVKGLVGMTSGDDLTIEVMLQERIISSFAAMIELQRLSTQRSNDELIAKVLNTVVQRDIDPRKYRYGVQLLSVSGNSFSAGGQVVR